LISTDRSNEQRTRTGAAPVTLVDEPDARRLLATMTQLERELVELGYTQRLDATERVREALRRLAETRPPMPRAVLERAAAELGGCTTFDRVLVSRVRDDALEPVAIWAGVGTAPLPAPLPAAATLPPSSVEAEVAAHARTLIVEPAQAAVPELAAAVGDRPLVLGAIASGGEVVALVHAGGGRGARPPTELERELVELFAEGLGRVLERAALEQALARHRGELAAASRFLERRLGAASQPSPEPLPPPRAAIAVDGDPLTGRELEVLALLERGQSNRELAQALGIAEGTVKYHVKNILRKLRARSRADAVARHLGTARR
jgi:DNA-binding CsgD family transcriptional regulator